MSKKLIVLCIFLTLFFWFLPSQVMAGFIVDYQSVDTTDTVIPQKYLDLARSKSIIFNHQSVGYNILDGLKNLSAQNPDRYRLTTPIRDYTQGKNGDPLSKINAFYGLINSNSSTPPDIAMMKLCYVDNTIDAQTIWNAYHKVMTDLETKYKGTTFVWWTMPITTAGDPVRDTYNGLVREYAIANGKILFDIASIESHDPDGNPVTNGGYEAMYSGYTTDGGHLTSTASIRVARAWWYLTAGISGWKISPPTPTVTPRKSRLTPTVEPEVAENSSPGGVFRQSARKSLPDLLQLPDKNKESFFSSVFLNIATKISGFLQPLLEQLHIRW